MKNMPAISIYNASAGAGKTFTLVKNYLFVLLGSESDYAYRNILALTFTNKAVAEMKSRILDNLESFGREEILQEPPPMFLKLCEMTGTTPEALQKKASRVFENILQDYSSFDVVTIDNFTHRVIRTFAKDLRIPQHFQVELNTTEVLEQAVDRVIEKIGTDKEITDVLLAYALEKIDDDRSWDISHDLNDIAKLLLNEDDQKYLALLREKSLQDFVDLKKTLKQRIRGLEAKVVAESGALLDHLYALGLEDQNFSGKYLPNRLKQYREGNFSGDLKSKWLLNIADQPLYKKTERPEIKSLLDAEQGHIASVFTTVVGAINKLSLERNLLKRLVPLSVLQIINAEVQAVKEEKNLLLISDFNNVIQKHIISEPIPFIYERLGERYRHYFIDEFQDTSVLQWSNLVPLIDSALSTSPHDAIANSLMVVGDPKQAIYRWRGGDANQFISLSGEKDSTFQNPSKETVQLPKNYRSYDNIVTFNNDFFQYCATFLSNTEYAEAFRAGNQQETNDKQGGQVSISFVDGQNTEQVTAMYLKEVLNRVQECTDSGYGWGAICVLVRKNSQGVEVANYLMQHEIKVVSGQSLLLSKSVEVQLIVNTLHLLQNPLDSLSAFEILNYLAVRNIDAGERSAFLSRNLKKSGADFSKALVEVDIQFDWEHCLELPLYEKAEYIARAFNLYELGGAHLQFFLDYVHSYAQKNTDGTYGFLQWFDKNASSLSISTPENMDAVQVMTIHKAKGLEFPVVIYPFADDSFYNKLDNLHWYPTEPSEYFGFKVLLLGHNKDLEEINEVTDELYKRKRSFQELDKYNELYVALTRSVERLHIITRLQPSSRNDVPGKFPDLFKGYLEKIEKWDESRSLFYIDDSAVESRADKEGNKHFDAQILKLFSSDRKSHNLQIVTHPFFEDIGRQSARLQGSILHDLLAAIEHRDDVEKAIITFVQRGLINTVNASAYQTLILDAINTLMQEGFFNPLNEVLNERELYFDQQVYRPDRLEITKDKRAFLLDYKTGKPEKDHNIQLNRYSEILKSMGYDIVHKKIFYLNLR